MNKNVIKRWAILGGKVLDFRYSMHVENITKIACAIQSCYNGCLDELKGDLDEKNIGQMFARMNRVNAIPKLFESQPKFKPDPTLENIPDMDNDESRLYATGLYAFNLSQRYLQFSRDHARCSVRSSEGEHTGESSRIKVEIR